MGFNLAFKWLNSEQKLFVSDVTRRILQIKAWDCDVRRNIFASAAKKVLE